MYTCTSIHSCLCWKVQRNKQKSIFKKKNKRIWKYKFFILQWNIQTEIEKKKKWNNRAPAPSRDLLPQGIFLALAKHEYCNEVEWVAPTNATVLRFDSFCGPFYMWSKRFPEYLENVLNTILQVDSKSIPTTMTSTMTLIICSSFRVSHFSSGAASVVFEIVKLWSTTPWPATCT